MSHEYVRDAAFRMPMRHARLRHGLTACRRAHRQRENGGLLPTYVSGCGKARTPNVSHPGTAPEQDATSRQNMHFVHTSTYTPRWTVPLSLPRLELLPPPLAQTPFKQAATTTSAYDPGSQPFFGAIQNPSLPPPSSVPNDCASLCFHCNASLQPFISYRRENRIENQENQKLTWLK